MLLNYKIFSVKKKLRKNQEQVKHLNLNGPFICIHAMPNRLFFKKKHMLAKSLDNLLFLFLTNFISSNQMKYTITVAIVETRPLHTEIRILCSTSGIQFGNTAHFFPSFQTPSHLAYTYLNLVPYLKGQRFFTFSFQTNGCSS